jgi:hypothetical protein
MPRSERLTANSECIQGAKGVLSGQRPFDLNSSSYNNREDSLREQDVLFQSKLAYDVSLMWGHGMLDQGVWADVQVGNEHLRLFSERSALGVQASVYNVNTKS